MKMMGLRNSVFWMSWVISYTISFIIVCILVILICKGSLFKYSDSGLLFAFFFSFCLSLIALACLVTTFFSRAKTAGTLSPFVLLAGYLPYFGVSDASKDAGSKGLACIFSPVAFSLGAGNIISFEGVFVGAQWNNSQDIIDNFKLGTSIGMMIFDALLYAALAWYLDKIWPREYGTPLKWYFLFTPSYWRGCFSCRSSSRPGAKAVKKEGTLLNAGRSIGGMAVIAGQSGNVSPHHRSLRGDAPQTNYGSPSELLSAPLMAGFASEGDDNDDDGEVDFGPDYEPVPADMRARIGVKIRGLRKEFSRDGNEVVAVEGLDLNLYQGQCFVLLGHNGAG